MKYKNMEELRKELDLLDNDLIKLVSKRFKFIEEAAIIKDDIEKFKMLYFEWKNKLWGDSKGFIIMEDKWEEYDNGESFYDEYYESIK